ncbi:MAG: AMP-binding protein [Cyanobacteria bacterium J06631_2]
MLDNHNYPQPTIQNTVETYQTTRMQLENEIIKVQEYVQIDNLVELLQYRGKYQPSKTAYLFLQDGEIESERLTYQQLDQQARAIAAQLQALRLSGQRALLLYPPGLEFIPAFFGCLYASVVAVPAYPPKKNQKLGRLRSIIADAQPQVILAPKSVLAKIQECLVQEEVDHIACFSTDEIDLDLAQAWQASDITGDSLAFLQYTSGSTGTPKGVMVTHRNLLHNEKLIKTRMGHSEKTVVLGWLPLFHDMGLVGNVLQPLYLGIPSVLMSPVAFLQKPIRWLQAISRYKATTSGGPNFAYDLCVQKIKPEECSEIDLSSWTVAFNGAEPIREETLAKFTQAFAPYGFRSQTFYPCYGMAETTLFVSGSQQKLPPVLQEADRTQLQRSAIANITNQGNVDRANTQILVGCGQTFVEKIAIVDPESHIRCQPDRVGEIWVADPSVAKGYWNRPEQTLQTFQAHLADTGEGPWLRTGDLGFIKEEELFITGRIKDVIIIRGRNHYPQDIEQTVEKSHSALRSGCGAAFSVEIDEREQLVVVQEVERSYIRKLDVDEVVAAIRKAVSEEHGLFVSGVILLKTASIPKTSSGKIQRHACKQGFLANSLNAVGSWTGKNTAASPSNPSQSTCKQASSREIQQWIVYWLSQKLKLEFWAIDPSSTLAEYGLDSLIAIELADSLGAWLGCTLDVTLFWNFPTIEALAYHLSTLTNSSTSPTTETLSSVKRPVQSTALNSLPQSGDLVEITKTLGELSESDIAQLLAEEITMVQHNNN